MITLKKKKRYENPIYTKLTFTAQLIREQREKLADSFKPRNKLENLQFLRDPRAKLAFFINQIYYKATLLQKQKFTEMALEGYYLAHKSY